MCVSGYNEYREWCGLGRAKNFQDLSVHITNHRALSGLSNVYQSVITQTHNYLRVTMQ